MFVPFHPHAGPLHRLGPGIKLTLLALAGTGLFLVQDARVMAFVALLCLLAFPASGLPLALAREQLRPVALLGAIIVLAQGLISGWSEALLVGARLGALLLLAGLVTLTTRTEAMVSVLEGALRLLAPLGVNPRKGALALSLGLRFVPLLAQITAEVREAQAARGLEHNLFALAVPVLVRAMRLTDGIADAIEARAFDADEVP